MTIDLSGNFKKWARNLMKSAQRRSMESLIRDQHPDVFERITNYADDHIRMKFKPSHGSLETMRDQNGANVLLVFREPEAIEELEMADYVLAGIIHQMESSGQSNLELTQLRHKIYASLFDDPSGGLSRFTVNDLSSPDVKGRSADLVSQAIEYLEASDKPYHRFAVNLLREENTLLQVKPRREGEQIYGGFHLDTQSIHVTYPDEGLSDQEIVARIVGTLMHEVCHLCQFKQDILADMAIEADHFRELTHLNELQAHVMQYKTGLELFLESQYIESYMEGRISKEGLSDALSQGTQLDDALMRVTLLDSDVGQMILDNIRMRKDEGLQHLREAGVDSLIKQALCHGRIDHFDTEGSPHYQNDGLTRMQRYAHSHIYVMNFTGGNGKDSKNEIQRAIKGHFDGDLGIKTGDIVVNFADPDYEFVSAFTGRELQVAQIESLWRREGGSDNISRLGGLSEVVMSQAADQIYTSSNIKKTGPQLGVNK